MTALQAGCAHDDCCRQRLPSEEHDKHDLDAIATCAAAVDELKALAGRVVIEMLERGLPYKDLDSMGTAIDSAVRAAPQSDHLRAWGKDPAQPFGSLRVINHPDSSRDYEWVDRYQVVREYEQEHWVNRWRGVHNERHRVPVLDFVVGGGLCVVTDNRGSWIVHPPAMQAAVLP